MRPRSLRAILTLYVAIILSALVVVRITSYVVTHNALGVEVDRRLATEAAAVAGDTPDVAAMAGRIAAAQADHDTADLYYALFDPAGRHIAGKLDLRRMPPQGYSHFGTEARVPGVAHGRALVRRIDGGGALVLVSDNDVIDGFDTLLLRVQLASLGTTALIVIGGAIGIWRAIKARMRAMQATVDAVIAGDIRQRIPVDGSRSEFDRQAAAFNRMLDRIEALMGNVKHAAKDVAHELKSPLARLRARTATLQRQSRSAPVSAAEIEDLLAQTDDVLEVFASMMRLWEVEGGHRRERFADLDLGALAIEVGEGLQAVAEDAGRTLVLPVASAIAMRGDVALLRQLLVNLIENAIRHTPPGTRITVDTEVRGESVQVIVADDGPGIPASEHAAMVRRFGRGEASASLPGQGLGLTLVDAIARLHHGRLILEDAAPGLRAVVKLPLAG
ncbi:histidine kinase [Sphingomonas sp. Leaf357]|uniref:sensor histidine kinase n=1 Tax=Sphingomonas sp. Leaf357 TaxID=1736350 RepID=UPI0006FF9487|nr:ATP-binding protein [Sphingomonas sp. Leaf357]KQS03896.1 histidine kinase [Sphingomonas sp. Leaf357]